MPALGRVPPPRVRKGTHRHNAQMEEARAKKRREEKVKVEAWFATFDHDHTGVLSREQPV